ncbi:hypothetical protein ACYULU_15350 [Breznakiellaceae bacterium SP9]
MTIQQTVDIPSDRRLVLDLMLPEAAPVGRSEVTVTLKPARTSSGESEDTALPATAIEDLKRQAAEKTARRRLERRKPFEGLYGALKDSKSLEGDPMELVRRWRDEWADS